jgi:AraC family transcriptional regulator
MPSDGPGPVPIAEGGGEATRIEVGGFRISDLLFPPQKRIPPHFHDRASLIVVLEGGFELSIAGRRFDCHSDTTTLKPAGELHRSIMLGEGAHVVVIQPDPADDELNRFCGRLLNQFMHFGHGAVRLDGRRLAREIRNPDAVSPLAIESLALEMLVAASRLPESDSPHGRPPAWLSRVREIVHAKFLQRLSAAEVASEVGVHPAHLARVFRSQYRLSMGAYVRTLRLEWAARRLTESDDPLSDVGLDAGFADQSHFTRAFRRHAGITPSRFRKVTRG